MGTCALATTLGRGSDSIAITRRMISMSRRPLSARRVPWSRSNTANPFSARVSASSTDRRQLGCASASTARNSVRQCSPVSSASSARRAAISMPLARAPGIDLPNGNVSMRAGSS